MIKYSILFLFLLLYYCEAVAQQPFVVVELFTSEGCNTCPPADKVLIELKAEYEKTKQPVYFLAYHVDYWNKLGWKDPFSKNQFTLRQENYSRVLPGKELYTPQVVINGEKEITGSDKGAITTAIQKALTGTASVILRIDSQHVFNDTLLVKYSLSKGDKNASVKFALTEDNLESQVLKGENAGKKLQHDAVVRVLYSSAVAELNGTIKIPLRGVSPKAGMQLIGIVQQRQSMKILGATKMSF